MCKSLTNLFGRSIYFMLLLNSLINSTIGAEYYSIDQRYKLLSIPIDLVESDTVEFHLEENKYFNKLYIMLW